MRRPNIECQRVKSNGSFGLFEGPYDKQQHQNQQGGLDLYVRLIDFATGRINEVKLYKRTAKACISRKMAAGTWMISLAGFITSPSK